jgi:hypothetical protein
MKAIRIATLLLLGSMPFAFSGKYELSARMQPSKPAPLGDGSIPIGKVRGYKIEDISVVVNTGAEQFVLFPDMGGNIRVPQSATPGEWHISARGSGAFPVQFRAMVQDNQACFFDLWLLPNGRVKEVSSVRIRHRTNPVQLRVGQWYWFNSAVNGGNVWGLWPSYWVDGSVGYLFGGGVFVATKPGDATLHAEVLGVHDAIRVKVLP